MTTLLSYWFALLPPPLHSFPEVVWTCAAVLALIAAVCIRWLLVPRVQPGFLRRPWRRVAALLGWTGALLLLFLFFRIERIGFFGARFWVLLLAIGDAAWIATIAREVLVRLPKDRVQWERTQVQRKYLSHA